MSRGFYRGVVEGMACGVLTIDTRGCVLTMNAIARQVLEVPLDESIDGLPCAAVLGHHPRLAHVLLESFRCTTLPNRSELELRTREEKSRRIGFSVSRIRDQEEVLLGLAVFFKDLTQVEEQEEQERLRDRLAALGGMAAQMAHEIRNPIAAISVTTQLIRRRLAAENLATEPADRIVREIARVEQTIAHCLEYVRPLRPALEPRSLRDLLQAGRAHALSESASPGLAITLDCGEGLDEVACDGPRLTEVFINLLMNANEAMGGRGTISIVARREERGGKTLAVIRFGDTGPGVPPDLRDRIFYPYFTTKTQGTGIGLAMARKIVEAHGGLIDVAAGPVGGAEFTIRLPLEKVPEPAAIVR
jgi:signal transduction histidine kinase